MPNITIDCTPNMTDTVRSRDLVAILHDAAIATGVFPTWGVRTMMRAAESAKVARGDPDMGFVQIVVRIAPGRDLAIRQRVAKSLFDAASTALEPEFGERRFGLQLEVQEFDAAVTFNRNTLDA